jgi:hypothetical protein
MEKKRHISWLEENLYILFIFMAAVGAGGVMLNQTDLTPQTDPGEYSAVR